VEIKERKFLVEQTLFVLLLASSFCQNMKLSDKHFSSLALLSPYQKSLTISPAFYWNTFDEALVNLKKDKPNVPARIQNVFRLREKPFENSRSH